MKFWNGMNAKAVLAGLDKLLIGDSQDLVEPLKYTTIEALVAAVNGGVPINLVIPLPIENFTDLDRTDLTDSIYNVDGAGSGVLIITKSYTEGVYSSVLQAYIDSGHVKARRIAIDNPQTYPEWTLLTLTNAQIAKIGVETLGYALSDQTTDITTGVKLTDRMPYAFTLTSILGSLAVAATGGTFTVNIKKNGVSIFSTKLTFDSGEATTATAAVPYVLTSAVFAANDIIEFSVDTIGSVTAGKGLIIKLIGTK